MTLHQPNPAILHSLARGSVPEGVSVIKVIDAIMGSGKTTFLIDRIRRINELWGKLGDGVRKAA